MTRVVGVAALVAALLGCERVGGDELNEGFQALEAVGVPGGPLATSLAVSADRRVVFGVGYSELWVQGAAGAAGRYEEVAGSYVATVGDRLVVAGGRTGAPGAAIFTSGDGWATLTQVGQSPLSIGHLAADERRVVVTAGIEILVFDRDRFLAGAGAEEAEVALRWSPEGPLWWEGTARATAVRGDVLWIAAGDGVRAYDLGAQPPALLYVLGSGEAFDVRLDGDALYVGHNERGGKYDVRDAYAPAVAGMFGGGDAFDVGGGFVFGGDSTRLTLSESGGPADRPVPLKEIPLGACLAVAALADRVVVSCDDQGTYELAPLQP